MLFHFLAYWIQGPDWSCSMAVEFVRLSAQGCNWVGPMAYVALNSTQQNHLAREYKEDISSKHRFHPVTGGYFWIDVHWIYGLSYDSSNKTYWL